MKTTRELGMKLKEAGAEQQGRPSDEKRGCSVFDCHELLEMLPLLSHVWQVERGEYMSLLKTPEKIKFIADTPAEALGKLYLWCLENGHCNE